MRNWRKTLALAAALLCIVAGSAGGVALAAVPCQPGASVAVSLSVDQAFQGDTVLGTLQISNTGNAPMRDITPSSSWPYGFWAEGVAELLPGQTAFPEFSLTIDDDAEPGAYAINVSIAADYTPPEGADDCPPGQVHASGSAALQVLPQPDATIVITDTDGDMGKPILPTPMPTASAANPGVKAPVQTPTPTPTPGTPTPASPSAPATRRSARTPQPTASPSPTPQVVAETSPSPALSPSPASAPPASPPESPQESMAVLSQTQAPAAAPENTGTPVGAYAAMLGALLAVGMILFIVKPFKKDKKA